MQNLIELVEIAAAGLGGLFALGLGAWTFVQYQRPPRVICLRQPIRLVVLRPGAPKPRKTVQRRAA